jgi:osmotically-inducible protein OsmY
MAMTDVERQSPQPDGYLCERVRQALASDPRVGELGIDVRVAGGRVFLTGQVATPERQQAISAVVAELLPDHDVHNDVSVTPLGAGPDMEVLA